MATLLKPTPLLFRVVLPAITVLNPGLQTIRARIVAAVKARLQTISLANDYETEVGSTVVEGLLIEAEPPVIPCINFFDGAETTQAEAGMVLRSLQLGVETYDKQVEGATPESLTQRARAQVTDIERALWRDPDTRRPEPTFGGLAIGMSILQSQPHIGLKPIPWIGSVSTYEITYRTQAGNPYSNRDDED